MQVRRGLIKVSRQCFVLLIGLSILISGFAAKGALASSGLRSQINNDKARLQQKSAEKSQVEAQIRQVDASVTALNSTIASLEADLGITREQVAVTRADLVRLAKEYDQKRRELALAKRALIKLNRVLDDRARSFYRTGKVTVLEVVLESKTFGQLIHRLNFLGKMVEYDSELVSEIKLTKARIESAQRHIAANKRDTEQKQTALLSQQERLQTLVGEQRKQQSELETQIAEKRKVMDRIGDEEAQLKQMIAAEEAAAAQMEAAERNSGVGSYTGNPSASGFIWPVNGTITGQFGEWRGNHSHSGLDIAAPYGTPIRAAKPGLVVFSGTNGGYGNVIDIDHGGGMKTRYAHNSVNLVSAGQNVSQGQQIANVGSTGYSTGPHVHFEVRINGNAVNPRNYLP